LAVWSMMLTTLLHIVESSWNLMAHGDAREGNWRGKWRMEWVTSTLHTTSEHGASSITIADAHTATASSRLNWRRRRFKWIRPFRRKTKSGFCAFAITFQTQSTVATNVCSCTSSPLRGLQGVEKQNFSFALWTNHRLHQTEQHNQFCILLGYPIIHLRYEQWSASGKKAVGG
jgi:hypothetical protein